MAVWTRVLLLASVLAASRLTANRMPTGQRDSEPEAVATSIPRPDHTVVVIMENHGYADVIGNGSAPYINSLRNAGANFTNSHGVSHPSEPNYLALFEGTTENLSNDSCPHTYTAANIASALLASGQSFVGYSESLPSDGYTGCEIGWYARKHNPWVNYTNVPVSSNLTFESFPANYDELPSVAYVVPDLCNDMHDCSVATGDAWLEGRLDGYIQWAKTHNSLLVLTFDEDGHNTATNQILTIFVGPMVRPGDDATRIDHYSVLRTLEDMYGVPATGNAAHAAPITSVWKTIPPTPTPVPRDPIILVRPRDRQEPFLRRTPVPDL